MLFVRDAARRSQVGRGTGVLVKKWDRSSSREYESFDMMEGDGWVLRWVLGVGCQVVVGSGWVVSGGWEEV